MVHAGTLFPVFSRTFAKPQVSGFGDYLPGTIATALADEGLAPDCLGPLDPAHVQVARTANRSGLGFMNDMAGTSQYLAGRAGDVMHLDTGELNALLRRTPYNRGGYFHPIDAARQR